ncbi:MAG: CoA-binding protein [Actinobacteria bacterium]|nr:CoA-binding protein [Actinomycetota bacterium]
MSKHPELSEDELRQIYHDTKTIAVVGASTDPRKAAHHIPAYLQGQGFTIVPVNPTTEQIFGVKAYRRLEDIPVEVDVVDVFRPGPETPEVAWSAVAIGAKVLWLQEGIANDEAGDTAREGGLKFVQDRCMGATHRFLFG